MFTINEDLIDAAILAYYSTASDDHEDSMIAAVQAVIDELNKSIKEKAAA